MPNFQEQPGYLFVLATILPLVSFLLILLASGAWCLARRYRELPGMEAAYQLFGGDKPGKLPALVALGAIALAFVCSLSGGVIFYQDQAKYLHARQPLVEEVQEWEHRIAEAKTEKEKEALHEQFEESGKGDELRDHDRGWEKRQAERWKGTLFTLVELRAPRAFEQDNTTKDKAKGEEKKAAPPRDKPQGTTIDIGFATDSLSVVMFVMVSFVASLIHLFSIGYMSDEEQETTEDHQVHTEEGHLHRRGRFGRFFMYLSLFCFSMLNLVLANNLFQVFISWELVGICSYLLIGFYFERQSASDAANKAFITNRVGDAGFILALLIVWGYLGTFNFDSIFSRVRAPLYDAHGHATSSAGQFIRGDRVTGESGVTNFRLEANGPQLLLFNSRFHWDGEDLTKPQKDGLLRNHGRLVEIKGNPTPREASTIPYWMLVAAGLGIFLGCVGKSAQFPLQVWLPDAMEGPTPVSALIHAATMVAAGVYFVGRCYPLFTGEVLLVIAYTGGITLFVAATIAIVMDDIKKVLAYSTVSQLGYMMLALGVGGWVAGLFHLVTHAFFKALLFLGSGSVIYGCHHEQDMQKMGGLFDKMKITALTMLAGVLAIAGIPLFSGWYSKDSILAQAIGFVYVRPQHALLFILPLMTAGITTFYMFRMWFMTFTGKPRDKHVFDHAHESPWPMTVPLIVLAVCSICVAWGWPVYSATNSWLEHTIHHAQPNSVLADFGHVHDPQHPEHSEYWPHEAARDEKLSERHWAHELHEHAGLLALGLVVIGIVFAFTTYYSRILDPSEAKEQFPRVHALLVNKWYFDHLYSVFLVRPAIVVARAFRGFDLNVIDGVLHTATRWTLGVARADGKFDNRVIDWLVNLLANVTYAIGARLRVLQTGSLRGYVLSLVLAAIAIFVMLAYFVAMAMAK